MSSYGKRWDLRGWCGDPGTELLRIRVRTFTCRVCLSSNVLKPSVFPGEVVSARGQTTQEIARDLKMCSAFTSQATVSV